MFFQSLTSGAYIRVDNPNSFKRSYIREFWEEVSESANRLKTTKFFETFMESAVAWNESVHTTDASFMSLTNSHGPASLYIVTSFKCILGVSLEGIHNTLSTP